MEDRPAQNLPQGEPLNRIDRVRDEFDDLKKSWNDRLVLERSSLAELYLHRKLKIALYGEGQIGSEQIE